GGKVRDVRERPLEDRRSGLVPMLTELDPRLPRPASQDAQAISGGREEGFSFPGMLIAGIHARHARRGRSSPLVERGLLERIARHLERLLEISKGTHWRVQRRGPVSRSAEGDTGLGCQGIRLRPWRTGAVRCQVVAGQYAGEVILAERFEVASSGDVLRVPVSLRQ